MWRECSQIYFMTCLRHHIQTRDVMFHKSLTPTVLSERKQHNAISDAGANQAQET